MAISYNSSFVSSGLVNLYDAANPKSFDKRENLLTSSESILTQFTASGTQYTTLTSTTGGPFNNSTVTLTCLNGSDNYLFDFSGSAVSLLAGDVVTQSWYVRPVTSVTQIYLRYWSGSGRAWTTSIAVLFTLTGDGSYSSLPANTTASITNVGGGWYRISFTATAQQDGFGGYSIYGTGVVPTNGVYQVSAPQVEKNAFPTEYIGTNGAAAPRSMSWSDVVGGSHMTIYGRPTVNPNGYFTFATNQTTQYMEANNFPMPTSDHTISYWFRPTDMAARSDQTPMTYVLSTDTNYFLMITVGATTFRVYRNTSLDITTPSMDNVWNLFTRTRVQSTGREEYFMNGQRITGRTVGAGGATTAGGRLIIGQEVDNYVTNGFSSTQNLNGDFSFLSIHNRALSNTEVQQCFNAMRGRYGV